LHRERQAAGVARVGDRAEPAPGLARPEDAVAPQGTAPQLAVAPPGDHAREVAALERAEPHLLADDGAQARAGDHGRKNRSPARSLSPACARIARARPGLRPTRMSVTPDGRSRGCTMGRPRCEVPALNGFWSRKHVIASRAGPACSDRKLPNTPAP